MNVFELVASLTLDTSDYEKGLQGSEKNASGFGSKVKSAVGTAGKITAAAITAATTAVVAFGKSAVDAGKEFDSSMSQVAATMGYTTEELNDKTSEASQNLQKLRDFAQEMGSTTVFSASEAAQALNYMALAGYDADTAMKMLPNVLNLAAAGNINLASASDMVTDAQSALGLSLEETNTMVDQMAKAASKSNTSVEQLGEAFLTVGGTAQLLNGGTVELSTVLGVLADNGIKGSEAGTHLRNIMLAMTPTSTAAADAFKQLGLEAYDSEGNMRALDDIFLDLGVAMEDMTSEEKTKIIGMIFNKTDIAAVNALLNTTEERWTELGTAITDSTGAAEAMASVQLDNLSGDITLFQSALEGAKIAVSDELTPTLREFVQFGADGLSRLTTAFNENGLSGAMTVFGELLSEGLNKVITMLPEVISAGLELVKAFVKGLVDNLPMIMSTVLEILLMLIDVFLDNLPMIIDVGIDLILALIDGLIKALPTLISKITDVVLKIVDKLTEPDTLTMLVIAAIELMIALSEGLIRAIPKIIEKIPQIVRNIVNAIIQAAPMIWEAGSKLIDNLWTGVKLALGGVARLAKTYVIDPVVNALKNGWSAITDIGKNIIVGLWNGMNDKVAWIKEKITNFTSSILGTIKSFFHISSPSKVMKQIGGYMAEGLGLGWEDEYADVKKQITNSLSMSLDMSAMRSTTATADKQLTVNNTVELTGEMADLFKAVVKQNKQNTLATGRNALAY